MHSSGHLVPSHLGLAYDLLVETNPSPEQLDIFFSRLFTSNIPRYFLDFGPSKKKKIHHCHEEFYSGIKGFIKLSYPVNICLALYRHYMSMFYYILFGGGSFIQIEHPKCT